jgi:hypothetical protein
MRTIEEILAELPPLIRESAIPRTTINIPPPPKPAKMTPPASEAPQKP